MSDLKTVREALELGNAAIDYEAGYRVMDAGLAALSRMEAQQEAATWKRVVTEILDDDQIPAATVEAMRAHVAHESDAGFIKRKIAEAQQSPGWTPKFGQDPEEQLSQQTGSDMGIPISKERAAPPVEPCPRCAANEPEIRRISETLRRVEPRISELVAERDRLQATVKALVEGLKGAQEELRLLRMKDTAVVYDPTLRSRIAALVAEHAQEKV